MPSEDLKDYATSDVDFYEVLGVTFETSESDLSRAWRKTALRYHPDKVGNNPIAKEKWDLARIGYDILSDPTRKALYDNVRITRLQKKRQNALFEGKRRQMKEDLEAREKGVKRTRDDAEDAEEKLEREIRRLAEDGKRRRKEREDILRKEMLEEAKAAEVASETANNYSTPKGQTSVPELDRTVKVRWLREGVGETIDTDRLRTLFSKFGKVENAFLLKDKKQRIGESSKKKKLVATGVIIYASVVGAHTAVEDTKKQEGPEWKAFDSVYWATNKEPDFINGQPMNEDSGAESMPSTPIRSGKIDAQDFLNGPNGVSTPSTPASSTHEVLRKMPSFASFSSAAASTPKSSPFGKGFGPNSPSFEEITMIRLKNAEKNAEKKRLEAELRKQDIKAAAGEAC